MQNIAHPGISVCIPAYEMAGKGAAYLKASLDVLSRQTFRRFEVIVADQSDSDDIQHLCANFPEMNVRWLDTRHLKRQASANTNAAIDAAQSPIVKILFQDDFLNGDEALAKIASGFTDPTVLWIVTGTALTRDGHSFFQTKVPVYHERIQFGINTVGCPSVMAFRHDNAPRFDETLIWLMDVDHYKQMALQFGPPKVIPEPLAVIRLHADQVTESVDSALVRKELRLMRRKYAAHMNLRHWWHYRRQLKRNK